MLAILKACYFQALNGSTNPLAALWQPLGLALHIEMRHQNEFTKCVQEDPGESGVICDGL
jgi:hypothetical protein